MYVLKYTHIYIYLYTYTGHIHLQAVIKILPDCDDVPQTQISL